MENKDKRTNLPSFFCLILSFRTHLFPLHPPAVDKLFLLASLLLFGSVDQSEHDRYPYGAWHLSFAKMSGMKAPLCNTLPCCLVQHVKAGAVIDVDPLGHAARIDKDLQ